MSPMQAAIDWATELHTKHMEGWAQVHPTEVMTSHSAVAGSDGDTFMT